MSSDLAKALLNGSSPAPEPFKLLDTDKLAFAFDPAVNKFVVTTLTVEYLARQFAGVFFEQNRSKKFRLLWGTSDKQQDRYIDHNWKSFIAPAREVMVKMLANPATPQDQKDMIYEALCQENIVQQVVAQDSALLQPERGTEAFDGEKVRNREVDDLEK